MSESNTTGQTVPASSATPDQGTAKSNPFEISPPATQGAEPVTPPAQTESQQQQSAQPTATQPAVQPQTQPTPTFNPADITKSIVDGIVQAQAKVGQPQVSQQQEQPMSQAEFRKHYGIPVVDANVYKSIIGVDPDSPERVAALDGLLYSFATAGVRMGNDLLRSQMEMLKSEFTGQISPLLSAHQQQQEAAIIQRFTAANPDLANDMATVNEVKDAMIARGVKFSSQEEMFKEVGNAARQLLTRIRGTQPVGGQQPGSQPVQTQASQTRQMTPTAQGGRGGNSVSGSKPTTAELVFGNG